MKQARSNFNPNFHMRLLIFITYLISEFAIADFKLAPLEEIKDGERLSDSALIFKEGDDQRQFASKKIEDYSRHVSKVDYLEKKDSIEVQLDNDGTEMFRKLTLGCIGKRLAIVVNQNVICAPVILNESKNGKIIIPLKDFPESKSELLNQIRNSEGKRVSP